MDAVPAVYSLQGEMRRPGAKATGRPGRDGRFGYHRARIARTRDLGVEPRHEGDGKKLAET